MSEGFRFRSGIGKLVERNGLRLVDISRGRSESIGYPDAAVLDLTTRHDPGDRVADQVSAITGFGIDDSLVLIETCLEKWIQSGVVEPRVLDG